MLIPCSGTIFHLTSGLDNQKSDSRKPSKPICLACTPEFQNLLSCLPHMLQLEHTLISVNPSPFPCLCHLQSLLLANALFAGTSTGFAVILLLSKCCCEGLQAQRSTPEIVFIIIIANSFWRHHNLIQAATSSLYKFDLELTCPDRYTKSGTYTGKHYNTGHGGRQEQPTLDSSNMEMALRMEERTVVSMRHSAGASVGQ